MRPPRACGVAEQRHKRRTAGRTIRVRWGAAARGFRFGVGGCSTQEVAGRGPRLLVGSCREWGAAPTWATAAESGAAPRRSDQARGRRRWGRPAGWRTPGQRDAGAPAGRGTRTREARPCRPARWRPPRVRRRGLCWAVRRGPPAARDPRGLRRALLVVGGGPRCVTGARQVARLGWCWVRGPQAPRQRRARAFFRGSSGINSGREANACRTAPSVGSPRHRCGALPLGFIGVVGREGPGAQPGRARHARACHRAASRAPAGRPREPATAAGAQHAPAGAWAARSAAARAAGRGPRSGPGGCNPSTGRGWAFRAPRRVLAGSGAAARGPMRPRTAGDLQGSHAAGCSAPTREGGVRRRAAAVAEASMAGAGCAAAARGLRDGCVLVRGPPGCKRARLPTRDAAPRTRRAPAPAVRLAAGWGTAGRGNRRRHACRASPRGVQRRRV
jgi:hypothetical protein